MIIKIRDLLSRPKILLALGIVLALLAGAGVYFNLLTLKKPALSPSQKEWLARKGKIVIAGDYAFPPFEYVEGNEYKGFNVDLVYSLALNLGVEVEIRPMLWEEARRALEEGRVDAIQGMRYTPERATIYSFSRPFLQSYSTIFILADRQGISSVNDLKGLKVAVQKGDVSYDYLSTLPEINILAVETQEEGLELLLEGKVDAFVGNKWVGLFILKKAGAEEKVKTVGAPLFPSPYCMAVRKGEEELLSILNTGLEILESNSTLAALYQKWFGTSAEIHPRIAVMPLLIRVSGLVIFLFLTTFFLYIWNLTLRREVRKSVTVEKTLRERLKALYELSRKLPLLSDEREIAQVVITIARDVVGVSSSSLWLLDESRGVLVELKEGGGRELSLYSENIVSRVARTGEISHLAEAQSDPQCAEIYPQAGSCLCIPIHAAGKILGVLVGTKEVKRGFSPDEQELLVALAEQASVALENIKLRRGLDAQLQDLAQEVLHRTLIQEIASLASSSFDIRKILNTAAAKIVETLGVSHCAIILFDLDKMEGTVEAEFPIQDSLGLKFDLRTYPALSYLIETRKPLVVPDVEAEPLLEQIRTLLAMAEIRSLLFIPLIHQENIVGSIGIEVKGEKREFSATEIQLLQAVAYQLTMAIQNARLYHEIQTRYHQLASLQDSIRVLNSYLDLDGILSLLKGLIIGLLDADRSAILLFDEEKKLRCVASDGLSAGYVSLIESLQIWPPDLEEAPPPLMVSDILKDPFFISIRGATMDEGISSALYLPLFHRGKLLGSIAIFCDEPRYFSPMEISIARAIADQAAVAINNAILFREVKKAGEEWDETFNGIREGIVLVDPGFRILRANEAFGKLAGLPCRELIGRTVYEVFPSLRDIHPPVTPQNIPNGREKLWHLKNRTFRIIHHPIIGVTGLVEKMVVIFEDITEKLALQNRLLQTHTLASLGKMASALAHELNNPLAVILGYASLLQMEPIPEKVREALQEMEANARRASNIVKAIADFAEQRPAPRLRVNVNQIVEQTLAFYHSELKSNNVEVTRELASDLPETGGDPYQLQQAFEQIIINAYQALKPKGGGKLIVRTRKQESPEPMIVIEFINDGPPIPEDILPHIFNPFVSGKDGHEGLGLSITYSIIARHGGTVWAENLPEGGVRFGVEIPIVVPEPDWALKTLRELEKSQSPTVLLMGKGLRILEMERTFSSWGYRCLKAYSLSEALELMGKEKLSAIFCLLSPEFSEDCFEFYRKAVEIEPAFARKFIFLVKGPVPANLSRLLRTTAGLHLVEPVDPETLRQTLGKIIFTTEG
ncbi:MAG: transporter substrate-binding domain-containing protein [Anaerolineae bacterium]|nr:transporter substrate-binding domain-containing protein [Anaerolineae bacterium]MDW8101819.1 transporter substrate-binding domain-containing protein [Anaerolineae bacterium]